MKSSSYYFHVMTKILTGFQNYISATLIIGSTKWYRLPIAILLVLIIHFVVLVKSNCKNSCHTIKANLNGSNIYIQHLSCWTELDGMLDQNFNNLKKSSNIPIQHLFLYRPFILLFSKMAAYKGAVAMVLTELVDSDDEKPRRENTREWIKRKRESGYFQNKFQKLKVEDRRSLTMSSY